MTYKDKLIAKYEKNGFRYEIIRRSYKRGEFTDFVIIKGMPKSFKYISPKITKDAFFDIYDLSVNYVMTKKRYDVNPVFIYPDLKTIGALDILEKNEDEVILSPISRLLYVLDKLVREDRIEFIRGKFLSDMPQIDDFLNKGIEKKKVLVGNRYDLPLKFMGVSPYIGFLNPFLSKGGLLINTHFFLMEFTDINTHYSLLGQPVGGLTIRDQTILPYLYNRSALFLYRSGITEIKKIDVTKFGIFVGGNVYRHEGNALIYMRPHAEITPEARGTDIAIVGREVVGYKKGGGMKVPDAGFVLHVEDEVKFRDFKVEYLLYFKRDVIFGIQGGPWLVRDQDIASFFDDPFYVDEPIYFPPTVFPVTWGKKSTARMALGIDAHGELVIVYVHGTNENTYIPKFDSRGFTLSELAEVFDGHEIMDAINLDGGGSAQLYIDRGEVFSPADRRGNPGLKYRRPVSVGIGFF